MSLFLSNHIVRVIFLSALILGFFFSFSLFTKAEISSPAFSISSPSIKPGDPFTISWNFQGGYPFSSDSNGRPIYLALAVCDKNESTPDCSSNFLRRSFESPQWSHEDAVTPQSKLPQGSYEFTDTGSVAPGFYDVIVAAVWLEGEDFSAIGGGFSFRSFDQGITFEVERGSAPDFSVTCPQGSDPQICLELSNFSGDIVDQGQILSYDIKAYNISEGEPLFAWQFDVAYRSGDFEYVGFTEGDFLKYGGDGQSNNGTYASTFVEVEDASGLGYSFVFSQIGSTISPGSSVHGNGSLGVIQLRPVQSFNSSELADQPQLVNPVFVPDDFSPVLRFSGSN
ncbi:hypothetical protein CL629_03290 [bacterium]|nr:hypothetical protein [bacterium]